VSRRWTRVALPGAIVVALLAGCSSGHKTPKATTAAVTIRPRLDAGQEVQRPKRTPANATGQFTARLKGTTLTWSLSYRHMSGRVTAADIQEAPAGAIGPVIVVLCGPCRSPASGSTLLGVAAAKAMRSGRTYVNLRTKGNPRGEVRSQIKLRT
jgi:outer membrane murein-binding lipoprotein Lpp